MAQPHSHVERFIPQFPVWAADNGCFSRASSAQFIPSDWLEWLASLVEYVGHCLFAVLPDVFGDGPATLARALPYVEAVRAMGYRVAIVAQPGMSVASYPWTASDALFVGGPDAWHRSQTVDDLMSAAGMRGLWGHDGRLNSESRFIGKRVMGFDSADGTFLKYGPDVNLRRLLRWIRRQRAQLPLWDFARSAAP